MTLWRVHCRFGRGRARPGRRFSSAKSSDYPPISNLGFFPAHPEDKSDMKPHRSAIRMTRKAHARLNDRKQGAGSLSRPWVRLPPPRLDGFSCAPRRTRRKASTVVAAIAQLLTANPKAHAAVANVKSIQLTSPPLANWPPRAKASSESAQWSGFTEPPDFLRFFVPPLGV